MLRKIETFEAFHETMKKLSEDGVILLAGDPPNPMTIGWGTMGIIWHKPVLTVYVRPTRYTYGLIEKATDFTVCILPEPFAKQLAFCGTRSGREVNKIESCGFTLEKSALITTPYISQSSIHIECRIIHNHRLDPSTLDPEIINRFYPLKDFHMVYYGEILGVFYL